MMSLREAHKKFMEENPDAKIGLSKFCDLRPAHVKLFDHLPHQVCVCSYHKNVRLFLVALKSDSDLSTNFSTFVNQIVCDSQSKECMSKECLACKDKLNIFSLPGTQQLHFIKPHGSDKLQVSDITDASL